MPEYSLTKFTRFLEQLIEDEENRIAVLDKKILSLEESLKQKWRDFDKLREFTKKMEEQLK